MLNIELCVDKESDLYNPFAEQGLLSDNVKTYIMERLQEWNLRETVQLEVRSEEEVDGERLRQSVSSWLERERITVTKERRENSIQQIWMFAIGLVFIMLSLFLEDRVGAVWFTVLSALGAFSTWEAASIWIVRNPKLKQLKALNENLAKHIQIVTVKR